MAYIFVNRIYLSIYRAQFYVMNFGWVDTDQNVICERKRAYEYNIMSRYEHNLCHMYAQPKHSY